MPHRITADNAILAGLSRYDLRLLIGYRRGVVDIVNPAGLAEIACPCFDIVHREPGVFLEAGDFKTHPFLAHRS